VDVDFADLAAREAHTGNGVDHLGRVERGEAFRGRVSQAGDFEDAWALGQALEVRTWAGRFALFAFKGVVYCEGGLAAECVGEALADAEVCALFEGGGGGRVENADLHAVLVVWMGPQGAAARVADFADEDGGRAEVELVALDLEAVLVVEDVLVDADFGAGCALVLDLDL
jgi:hypothetical protein